MKKGIFLICFFIAVFVSFPGCGGKHSSDKSSNSKTTVKSSSSSKDTFTAEKDLSSSEIADLLSKLEGAWYDSGDIQSIKEGNKYNMITIIKNSEGYTFQRIFPDTGMEGAVKSVKIIGTNKYILKIEGIDDNSFKADFTIEINEGYNQMIINSTYDQNKKYCKISKELKLKIEMLKLSGIYRDLQGKTYEFKEGGIAIWPDNIFKYSLALSENPSNSGIINDEDTYYLIINNNNGKEISRYIIELIANKLSIYKIPNNNKSYSKGELYLNLSRVDNSTSLNQKAIDLVASKFSAEVIFQGESGQAIYKSSLGNISFDCIGPNEKGDYSVRIIGEDSKNAKLIKLYNVDIKNGTIEEIHN